MNKYFNFEIYLCDPISKTTGWKITRVSVKADNKKEAIKKLLLFPNFDTIILFEFSHEEILNYDFLITEIYPKFKIIEKINLKN